MINTVDVIAVQRFFLGQSTGTANTGKYQFNPVNRIYPALVGNRTAQNFDALIFGDVATGFVHLPESDDGMSAGEVTASVAAGALPEAAANQSMTSFLAAVRTSAIECEEITLDKVPRRH